MTNREKSEINDYQSTIKISSRNQRLEISGSEKFVKEIADPNIEKILYPPLNEKKVSGWARWAPEYFTLRIYERFTEVRVLIFWLLITLYIIDLAFVKADFIPFWFTKWNLEIFTGIATKMAYLLLSIGAFTAAFFTITIGIIKKKKEEQVVKVIWANLVKYAIYPFIAAALIGVVLFLLKAGLNVSASFLLFLLFVFLTINSFYTTIKIAEHLANLAFGIDLDIEK